MTGSDLITLGPRQSEILRVLLEEARRGRQPTNHELADELGIKVSTVQTLVRRMCAKFGVRNRQELVFRFITDPELKP